MDVLSIHPAFKQLVEGSKHLGLDAVVAKELVSYLMVKRAMLSGDASCQAVALSMSPSADMDQLWHWMLLNTHVRDEVHKLVGGDVPYTTATATDPEHVKLQRRNTAQEAMRSLGFSPNASVWYCSPDTTSTDDEVSMPAQNHRKRKLPYNSAQACDGHGSYAALEPGVEQPGHKNINVNIIAVPGQPILLRGTNSITVAELQQMLDDFKGIPVYAQTFLHAGNRMLPDMTLSHYSQDADEVAICCMVAQYGADRIDVIDCM